MELERELNPAQYEAVRHPGGPLLILAGAGSGKTRVITYRIAELLNRRVPAERILAVTFTNKAAGEMRERVHKLVGEQAAGMWIGTFHSTCARLLRGYAEHAGLPRDFGIFDDTDVRSLVVRVLKELGINDRFTSPRAVMSAIDQAKNKGLGPDEYEPNDYFTDMVARIYPVYQERLEKAGGVDFGDLLLKVLRLCRRDDQIGRNLEQKFAHVLVDEFQDTNRVQYDLVCHLARSPRGEPAKQQGNLCVVGDDDQSIYRWRGADVRNILEFERDHPGAHVVRLEQNYRSTQIILDAANAVIARNLERKQKHLFTEQGGGDVILYHTADDERREADFVVRAIRRLEHDEGRAPDDFAVFYRTHAQSRALEEALRAADVAYTVIGGTRFYDRAEIKDVISYLRAIANPADEISLERIINSPPRGIGDTTVERVAGRAKELGVTLWQALELVISDDDATLGSGPKKKVAAFVEIMRDLRARGGLPSELAEATLERTGYLERLAAERNHESEVRAENLMELVGSMKDWEAADTSAATGQTPSLTDFLERVSLVSPVDAGGRGVSLMTVHAAKGLEFPVVFVTGLEEGVFPSQRDGGTDELQLEEERRLAYVAITRARERLFLTNARVRRLFGQEPRAFAESRFIADIPDECIAVPYASEASRGQRGARPAPRRPPEERLQHPMQRRPAADAARRVEARDDGTVVEREHVDIDYDDVPAIDYEADAPFRLGQQVRHSKFGVGEVRGFTGSGNELKLTVYFSGVGPKTIIARFVEAV